jgi:hypothetical protein
VSPIAELTQQIDPWRPLPAAEGKEGELYVDWQKALGGDDGKLRLSREIARRSGQAAAHLLTGLHGTGKTTELYRVKNLLEAGVDDRRTISEDEWRILVRVHATKEPVNGPESDKWNDLIRGQCVFAYYQGGPSYRHDWNPVLQYAESEGHPPK